MARNTEAHAAGAYRVAGQFVERALRASDSIFCPGRPVWTQENLGELHRRFNSNPVETSASFMEKFSKQLEDAPEDTILLAAELFAVHLSIALDVGGAKTREHVNKVLSWMKQPATIPDTLAADLDSGICATGVAFNTYRPHQLWLFIDFAIKWKGAPEAKQSRWLADPWAFREMLFAVPHRAAYVQRHALLHMIHPDSFEDIVSRTHKSKLVEGFAHLVPDPDANQDRKILAIREALTESLGRPPAFYSDEMKPRWLTSTKEPAQDSRRYWAGGHSWGDNSKASAFMLGNYWEIGYPPDSDESGAEKAWKTFAKIRVGDWLAIKGYGGQADLKVYYVGEVKRIFPDEGRVDLERLDMHLYRGKGPKGAGSGNWWLTLLEVKRADIIEMVFSPKTKSSPQPLQIAKNLILYGPPGTGKTYTLRETYQPAFTAASRHPDQPLVDHDVGGLTWFQVLALALHDLGAPAKTAELQAHPWVRARYDAVGGKTPLNAFLWANLQRHTIEGSSTVSYTKRAEPLVFDKAADGAWFFAETVPEEIIELHRQLKPQASSRKVVENFDFTTFHPSTNYEDFIEGIRPEVVVDDEGRTHVSYKLVKGLFLRACVRAIQLAGYPGTLHDFCELSPEERREHLNDAPPYAVFIDEISRGNVPQIFGELITLIEPDKRLGAEHELIVTLPHSGRKFGVPSNLYLIGTMNTADRSVQALDTALRRRFAFDELLPNYDLLDFEIEETVHVGTLLRTINARIERLYDRDHQIGHSYLLPLADGGDLAGLIEVFAKKIVPLLQEYFYEDYGRIGLVLGKSFVQRRTLESTPLADFDADDYDAWDNQTVFELKPLGELSAEDFRGIYDLEG